MRRVARRLRTLHDRHNGVTVLELVAIVVVIGILSTLVIATYAGVQRNERNQERTRDIQDVYQQLEAYYVVHSEYPTLANMNSTAWVTTNMKTLNLQSLRDPASNSYKFVTTPTKNVYSYQVTAADGGSCNNTSRICAHYTLTATLNGEAQKTFVKSSLN
ncbi:MAG TPA: hypothetical protein VMR28_01075 [Candidatus Saccharimonadales bacterium]|nr:hypothetical protein [Candidatus Saccharimonadales bacterium]